jgi:FkbM family methyltransferase
VLPTIDLLRCGDADYMVLATNDAISDHLRHRGAWEPHLVAISRLFVQGIAQPFILDLGANLGAYAIPLAKAIAGVNGTIYAYEPQRIVYYQLCGNIFLNRLDNVSAFCMAIGDSDGSISVPGLDFAKTRNVGGFSLVDDIRNKTDYVVLQADKPPVETPMARLDSLHFPKPPCLIKIDVEGYDLKVLAGGEKLLESGNFPPILFEAWNFDWFKAEKERLFGFLHRLGYETTAIFADDYVAQHPRNAVHIDFVTDGSGRFNMTRVRKPQPADRSSDQTISSGCRWSTAGAASIPWRIPEPRCRNPPDCRQTIRLQKFLKLRFSC